MEHHGREEMDSKEESPQVWADSAEQEQNTAQVHFVPEGGTVAQIVYSDEQDRPSQQVVYTADGTSYTSVDTLEHTLVYIHPVEATQTLFTDPSQVAYVQQDATTQQASLPVHNQVLPPMEAVDGSDPLAPLQNQMERMETKEEDDEDEDEDEDGEDTDMDEWDPDPPRPFDPNDLWCEECNNAHPSVCPKHGPLHPIPNRPVLTRARASLPLVLYIDRFLGGVFSKRRIPKRTQFGPVEGPLVRQTELKDCYIHLKVSLDKGDRKDRDLQEDLWFELSSEALCNWMMFVRPAQNHLEQNLVAYQYGHHIYYTTIKNVEPKQELKFWMPFPVSPVCFLGALSEYGLSLYLAFLELLKLCMWKMIKDIVASLLPKSLCNESGSSTLQPGILCFGKEDHITLTLQKFRNILNESLWTVLPVICVKSAGNKWETPQVKNFSIRLGTTSSSTLLTSILYNHTVGSKVINLISFRATGSHV